MLYAKVVVGLPIEGPFDYSIPQDIIPKIKTGSRVLINFSGRKMTGYVIGLSKLSKIAKIKPIISLLDETPLLDKKTLLLAKDISGYYCCSLGEAIEAIIPSGLRKGKVIQVSSAGELTADNSAKPRAYLVHDLAGDGRWADYIKRISEVCACNKSVIIALPDLGALKKAEAVIKEKFPRDTVIFYRNVPGELETWCRIREGEFKIVLGLRSAIFAPLKNLGLIIVDEEEQSVYKQDQVPHYHARESAMMRSKIEGADLVLGSCAPSLESMFLAEKGRLEYKVIPRVFSYPEVKLLNPRNMPYAQRKKKSIFAKALEDSIYSELINKGKVLIFLNRKGFATYAYCSTCGIVFKCPRCNVNLVYHFKEESLRCHYCNYKMALLNICPACNSGYIKLGGTGTEKIESEVARIFPQARLTTINDLGNFDPAADIFISTSAILKHSDLRFNLIAVVGIDNSFNRVDFRAQEKAYALLAGLTTLTEGKVFIQTSLSDSHVLSASIHNDAQVFYKEELKQRKRFNFPPFKNIALIKLRGKVEEGAKNAAEEFFRKLSNAHKPKSVKVLSVSAAVQAKLRGNYYWQVLASGADPRKLSSFIKLNLKDFRHSGIIVTVDIDPL